MDELDMTDQEYAEEFILTVMDELNMTRSEALLWIERNDTALINALGE